MKRWKIPMKRCRSPRAISRVAKSLRARRRGVITWLELLGLGRRRIGIRVGRARDRRHRARRGLARLAGMRRLDEELRLLDPLRRELRSDALGRARVAVEQGAAKRALPESVQETLAVEGALLPL